MTFHRLVVWFLLAITVIVGLIVFSSYENHQYRASCIESGGHPLLTRGGWVCVSSDILIQPDGGKR